MSAANLIQFPNRNGTFRRKGNIPSEAPGYSPSIFEAFAAQILEQGKAFLLRSYQKPQIAFDFLADPELVQKLADSDTFKYTLLPRKDPQSDSSFIWRMKLASRYSTEAEINEALATEACVWISKLGFFPVKD